MARATRDGRFHNADDLPRHFKRREDKLTACGITVRLGKKTDDPHLCTCAKCCKALNDAEARDSS